MDFNCEIVDRSKSVRGCRVLVVTEPVHLGRGWVTWLVLLWPIW